MDILNIANIWRISKAIVRMAILAAFGVPALAGLVSAKRPTEVGTPSSDVLLEGALCRAVAVCAEGEGVEHAV